ncbi:MAG: DUF342 domain-containing protein [Phycisphaerales bacterium]|nr:DUF342 domain-containing protein [Phycisphaerales bacterium]
MSTGACDLDALLKLTTDSYKLEGTLQVAPIGSSKGFDEAAVTAFLGGEGVQSSAIQKQAVQDLIKQVLDAPLESHQAIVAVGTPAVNGDSVHYSIDEDIAERLSRIQARLESIESGSLTEQDESEDSATDQSDGAEGDHMDSSGEDDDTEKEAISYYDQMSYVVVQKGDLIAHKSKRSAGFDGMTIFGTVIPAVEGKSNDGFTDDSIIVSKDGACTAAFAGVLNATPMHISVSKELEIRGDVDFTSGRIAFPGSVSVQGSVRDRFSVIAEGDISINGLVERAKVISQGSITLSRGMAGKDVGRIRAEGDLDAGYLEGVHARVHGRTGIRGEITNCQLNSLGEINSPQAAIRGGVICATKGAVIASAGSETGVATELVVGSVPEIEERVRSIDFFLEKLEKQYTINQKKLDTFSSAVAKPTPSQIEEQMGLQFEVDEVKDRIHNLHAGKRKLSALLKTLSSTRVEFKKAVYPKVVLYIPGYRIEFTNELLGETIIELGPTGGPSVWYRGQREDLKDLARVIPDDRILRVQDDSAEEAMVA